jgi:hypothetical protein
MGFAGDGIGFQDRRYQPLTHPSADGKCSTGLVYRIFRSSRYDRLREDWFVEYENMSFFQPISSINNRSAGRVA